jgi:hypothetical protein
MVSACLTISHLLDDLLALCSCDAYELSVDSKCLIMCYKCSRLKVIRQMNMYLY